MPRPLRQSRAMEKCAAGTAAEEDDGEVVCLRDGFRAVTMKTDVVDAIGEDVLAVSREESSGEPVSARLKNGQFWESRPLEARRESRPEAKEAALEVACLEGDARGDTLKTDAVGALEEEVVEVAREVASSEPDSGDLNVRESPRSYQLEILEKAKKENIVAYLETGAGKTLIAALLMKQVLQSSPGKYAVFVVDRVPLVVQQAKYTRRVAGDTVSTAMFYGDMDVDSWGEQRWAEALEGKNAIFITAQVFLNLLRHDVFRLANVALLIFDEAHHATKEHPFNLIMREFYFPARRARLPVPRIFGMSASPVKVKSDSKEEAFCRKAVITLERNLHCRVVSVSNAEQFHVDQNAPKPEEFALVYTPEAGADTRATTSSVGLASGAATKESRFAEVSARVRLALGSYAASFWEAKGDPIKAEMMPELPPLSAVPERFISNKVRVLLDLLVYESRRWSELPDVSSSFRAIVFVETRAVACCLAWLVSKILESCNSPALIARAVTGANAPSSNMAGFMRSTHSRQTKTLAGFRKGEFGILIATNVLEEGVDVPSCGLVVMFDSVTSSKAYIQSRGRARHPAARYVAMVPSVGDERNLARSALTIARDGSEVMKAVVRELSDEPAWSLSDDTLDDQVVEKNEELYLRSKTTQARVSPTAAIVLLNQFCACLPKDKYVIVERTCRPVYHVKQAASGFVCRVTLPVNCPVAQGECRVGQPSQVKAKRMAALDAYTKLYECGALDERLYPRDYLNRFPVPVKDSEKCSDSVEGYSTMRDEILQMRQKKRAQKRERACTVEADLPFCWERERDASDAVSMNEDVWLYEFVDPSELTKKSELSYMNKISLTKRHGIMVKHKFNKEDLNVRIVPSGQHIISLALIGKVSITHDQDIAATRYGLALYQLAVDKTNVILRRRSPASGQPRDAVGDANELPANESLEMAGFHLVPLRGDVGRQVGEGDVASLVDWDAMKGLTCFRANAPFDDVRDDAKKSRVMDYCIVQSRHDAKFTTYFVGPPSDLRANSPCGKTVGGGGYATYEEYFSERHGTKVEDPDQVLVPGFKKGLIGRELSAPFHLVPEHCRMVPVSPWTLYYLGIVPQVQTFVAVQTLWRKLPLERTLPFPLIAEALQPRRSSQQCVGVNYERLEFLGDAVLKALASIMFFCARPHAHEGILTKERDEVVCNSFLCDRSFSLKLSNVVAMTGASGRPRAWPWLMGSPQKLALMMSEKVLADCIESLIGVHFDAGGLPLAARLVDELEICRNVRTYIGKPFIAPERPGSGKTRDVRESSPRLKEVEGIIGYSFKDRKLLVEALTHASYRHSEVQSYQRLEFLGDAVIGFIILKGFFYKYSDLDPAQLTLIREPALSNELFARVVVEHGLHKYLWFDSDVLANDMKVAAGKIIAEQTGEDVCEKLAVPKVLGDILESIIGAIVVDQGMRLDGVAQEVVERLTRKALDRFANPDTLPVHPVTKMAQVLQTQYQEGPEFIFEEMDGSGGRTSMANAGPTTDVTVCTVRVAGITLASAKGVNRRKAKRSAAQAVLAKFDAGEVEVGGAQKKQCMVSG